MTWVLVDAAAGVLTGWAGASVFAYARRARARKPLSRVFCKYKKPRVYGECTRMASLTCDYGFCRQCCKDADCPDHQVVTAEKGRP